MTIISYTNKVHETCTLSDHRVPVDEDIAINLTQHCNLTYCDITEIMFREVIIQLPNQSDLETIYIVQNFN